MQNIFVSATTRDLRRVRQHVTELVLQSGFHPVVEEGFEGVPDNIALSRYLNLKLKACAGMIHIVGLCFGGEAKRASPSAVRRSWTQMEYHCAKRSGKDVLVCLADPSFYRGKMPTETKEKVSLQRAYYEKLKNGEGFHYPFKKRADITSYVHTFLGRFKKSKRREKLKVLYIGAERGTNLDLRGQVNRLRKAVTIPRNAQPVEIIAKFNVPSQTIIEAINREQPTIVHLSGKQEGGVVMLHDERGKLAPFNADLLAEALANSAGESLKLVILDTCYSFQQAQILTKRGIAHSIGVYDSIADDVADDFYAVLYTQLAAGKNLESARNIAFNLTVGAIQNNDEKRNDLEDVLEMDFNSDLHIPRLISARGFDASHETFS